MRIDVGVIGVGATGRDQVPRSSRNPSGARVVVLPAVDPDRARVVAAGLPGGPRGPVVLRDRRDRGSR